MLDRNGITTAIANMLKANSTLYGASGLLQIIEGDPKKFNNAKVDAKRNRHALYLWASDAETVAVRAQNEDVIFTVDMRFEALDIDTTAGIAHIEDAYQLVRSLVNKQMWNGQYLTAYYTDTTATVINIEPVSEALPAPENVEGGFFTIEVEGAITVEINRINT